MSMKKRPTLVGALVGALALGAGVSVAAAQQTQDSSQTGQTTNVPKMPGQGGAVDTAGYSGIERPQNSPHSYSQDTSRAGQSGQDTSRTGQSGATGQASSSSQDTSRTQPRMPQQGGAADTSGYTEFKETMGKSKGKDTLSAAGKTTNYRQHKQYRAKPSVVDTTPGQGGQSGAASQDTSRMRNRSATGSDTSSMQNQSGNNQPSGMRHRSRRHHRMRKDSTSSQSGATGATGQNNQTGSTSTSQDSLSSGRKLHMQHDSSRMGKARMRDSAGQTTSPSTSRDSTR
jgi:hypothetical protein